jgi:aspartate/methionine/tyrosine aminotransferase
MNHFGALKDEGRAVSLPLFLTRLLIRSGAARWLPRVRRWTDGGSGFLRYYSDHILSAPHQALREASSLVDTSGPDAIDLSLGAPRFEPAPSTTTRLPPDRRGWPPPWGLPELRAAVAEKLLADQQLDANPVDEVLITLGGAGAFSVAADTFLNPGDRVALFDPCSLLYPLLLNGRRARVRWIDSWVEDGRLRFRPEHLKRAMNSARMIVVNSPHNPTGGVLAPEDLEMIAWWADRRDMLIFNDEVFERYQYEEEALSIGTLPRAARRTLTVGSMSKGHGLASARIGWIAGNRHLVRPCLVSAVLQAAIPPALSQLVALAALRQDPEAFQPTWNDLESRRRYAYERLRGMGLKPIWPAGGFFFWVPVWELGVDGRTFADRLAREKKVLVTPGKPFGPTGTGYVRISYAVEDGRLREGLMRLAEFLRGRDAPAADIEKWAA